MSRSTPRSRCAGLLVASALLLAAPLAADSWRHLGMRTVDVKLDHDVIHCSDEGMVKQIVFEVRRAPVHFHDVKVYFGNGDVIDVALRQRVPKGERSRVIDLPGEDRHVKRVEFWYDSAASHRGEVHLWGRK